jgi:hypothetical protein
MNEMTESVNSFTERKNNWKKAFHATEFGIPRFIRDTIGKKEATQRLFPSRKPFSPCHPLPPQLED